MARKKHLINVHTSTGTTAPTGASLYLGEIAVQHTHGDPALWIKVGSAETSTEYEKFIGLTEITNIFNMSHILGSGYTYSGLPYVNSATTIADAYSALTREMIDDEIVVASALNDLNVRVDALCAATGDNTEILEYVQENEEAVAGALNNLNERLGTVETQMTGDYIPITGYMTASGSTEEELTLNEGDTVNEALGKLQKQMLDNEEAIAAGLNDLNTRLENVDELIAHNTGVTQLSGAVRSLSAATVAGLQELYNSVENNFYDKWTVNSFSSATQALSSATQALSSATQTFAKSTLTVNLNGVEQGKYTPWSGNTVIDLTAVTNGSDVLLTGYELATGTTEEELAVVATDTVNEAFGKIQKQNYDNEAVVAGALNDLDERITFLEVSGSSIDDLEELSGAVVSNELVIAAALNDLNARIVEISGNTGGAETDPVYSSSIAATITQQDIDNWNAAAGGGSSDPNAITGITMNGNAVSVSGRVAALGTVVTSQTQLSKGTATGTGNVVTDINVSNHQITLVKSYSAAPADQFVTMSGAAHNKITALSAATTGINATLTAHTNNGDIHVTAAQKTTWDGKQDAISDLATIRNNASSGMAAYNNVNALSAGTIGELNKKSNTGHTHTISEVSGLRSALDGKSDTGHTHPDYASSANLQSLSAATTGINSTLTTHTGDSSIHVTTSDKSTWNGKQDAISDLTAIRNGSNSGASAYTAVTALSAATTAHTANTTVHVTSANKDTWNGKQDAISDLSTIRNNASSGAAAYTAVTAHTGDSNVHVTAAQKTNWTNSGTSGANAYVGYIAHSANTGIHVTSTEKSTWNGKQDAISDLATIRTNAASGMAAYDNVNALSAATTAHTSNSAIHVPTGGTNGQVLMMVNGTPAWATPVSIYTGSTSPSQSLGNDGDIYLQTS